MDVLLGETIAVGLAVMLAVGVPVLYSAIWVGVTIVRVTPGAETVPPGPVAVTV
jgi:ABC-type arginine/histidine transport system permease subunit